MMRTLFAILFSLCLVHLHGQSQPKRSIFFSPGVSIGYTFGAKINFGFFFDAGIIRHQSENFDWRYGVSFYQYYVKTKSHIHRLRSFSLMVQTDFADVKVGIGRVRNKWGARNGNHCLTHGLSFDVSFAYPHIYSPWIGFRHFVYPPSTWAWFMTPYNSVYMKYKYDIIQNTELKETVKFN